MVVLQGQLRGMVHGESSVLGQGMVHDVCLVLRQHMVRGVSLVLGRGMVHDVFLVLRRHMVHGVFLVLGQGMVRDVSLAADLRRARYPVPSKGYHHEEKCMVRSVRRMVPAGREREDPGVVLGYTEGSLAMFQGEASRHRKHQGALAFLWSTLQ